MKTKWHILQGRFTENEVKLISAYVKKHNIANYNQLITKTIKDLVTLTTQNKLTNVQMKNEGNLVFAFYKLCRDELDLSISQMGKFDSLLKKFASKNMANDISKRKIKIRKSSKLLNSFKHLPPGRPNEKRKPGRPRM